MDNSPSLIESRSELYRSLAESLAEMPEWMLRPGKEWPLTAAAATLAAHSDAAEKALDALEQIPPESEGARHGRYKRLFGGPGSPRFWLYESMWRTGRFLGPEMVALEQLYGAVGLQVVGAEAADHASVELAFLAHLVERQGSEPELSSKWRQLERLFIKKHAGQWLPVLGRSLASSGDAVYGPVGQLLAGWIMEAHLSQRPKREVSRGVHWPMISNEALCSLCGFCVQVCPTHVLNIQETDHETMLRITAVTCNGCGKCIAECPSHVLNILAYDSEEDILGEPTILRRSPRVLCPGCGQPTVSQAELDFVAEQVGQQEWLPYCLLCRSELR